MYIEKTMSINGVVLEDYPFNKEVFLEGFLLEHLTHICPPGYEASGVDPVNQIPVQGGGQDGSNGRIDIAFELAAESNNPWALAEIKNVRLDIPHLNQLLAYLLQQQQLISEIQKRLGQNVSPGRWIGILVGPSIDASLGAALVNNAWQELPGINHNLKDVEIGAVVVNRYREKANNAIYVFADKYFPIRSSSTGRDYSKFSFDDRQHWYGAAEFVREYIGEFCTSANIRDLAALQQQFPKHLQGSYEVVAAPASIADPLRYSKQSFRVGSDAYEVCTQWGYAHGKGNLANFIDFVKRLGAKIYRMTPDGVVALL